MDRTTHTPGSPLSNITAFVSSVPCQLLRQSQDSYRLVTVGQMMGSSFQIVNRNVT